ncbi:MAG: FUSC family protein [Bdellovibrionaceae bacterium]|nr:FUSC family protein [Pseudobdellovibrionaceae bacterium]
MIDLGHFKNQILTRDPGLQALRNALRGTVTIVVSFLLLSFLAKALHQAPTLAFVGVLVAMMSSMLISDATVKQQKRTLLWMILPAAIGLSGSILLAPVPTWRLGLFLVVTFLAVAARRHGPRATALGFMAFMSYVSAMLFPMPIEVLPWVFGAVLVALGTTFLMRFVIFADRPRRILELFLQAFDAHMDFLLGEMASGLRERNSLEKVRKNLRRRLVRLNELSLTVEQFLKAGTSHGLKTESEALHLALFERELNLRKLIDALRVILSSEQEAPWRDLAEALSRVSQRLSLTSLTALADRYPGFWKALLQVEKDRQSDVLSPERLSLVVQELKEERKADVVSKASFQGLHASTKQAIQATLATGVAWMFGTALSPERWYWASITAFVVFAGASRGDTITRAVFRIVGTFLGLVVGAGIAFGLKGHHGIEWASIIFFVFLGLLGARLAFGFFSAFAFTLMLAVLYDLMGLLTDQILLLRLEETAVGAFVGAIVSIVVLPTSTRSTARASIAKLLRTMGEIAQKLPLENPDMAARKDLVSSLRLMDRDILNMRTTLAPLLRNWTFFKTTEVPLAFYDLTILASYLRHLATNTIEAYDLERMRQGCAEISKDLQFLAKKVELNQSIALEKKESRELSGHHHLDRISQILVELSARKV